MFLKYPTWTSPGATWGHSLSRRKGQHSPHYNLLSSHNKAKRPLLRLLLTKQSQLPQLLLTWFVLQSPHSLTSFVSLLKKKKKKKSLPFPLISSFQALKGHSEVSPESSLLQAEQDQTPQPFFIEEMLQPSQHPQSPPLDLLQQLHIPPVLGNTVFQMGPYKRGVLPLACWWPLCWCSPGYHWCSRLKMHSPCSHSGSPGPLHFFQQG